MEISNLRKELKLNIGSSTGKYRAELAKQVIENQIPVGSLIDLLLESHPISTRFSWLLGDIIMQSPEMSKEVLTECYKIEQQVEIINFDRSLSKQIMFCGEDLPEDLEGELVTKLFEWLMDPKILVSTKNNCLFALETLCKKYPDLKYEFIEVVNLQKDVNSSSFKKRAEKVLSRLTEE